MDMEIVRSSKKLKSNVEETKDFISELPDSMLVHILSFLPTQDAIKTVLLKRFDNLWRSVPVLDLKECVDRPWWQTELSKREKFVEIVSVVPNLHDVGVLERLSLKICFDLSFSRKGACFYESDSREAEREKVVSGYIEKLLGYALDRKVEVLDLDFDGGAMSDWEFYVLPDDIFRSNYLTEVRLRTCEISSHSDIRLEALKVLSLNGVSLLTDKLMENILLGCPFFLEELSLVYCYGRLSKLYCTNPNLKKLKLTLNIYREMIYVACPHVTSLDLGGRIGRATLLDVSSLKDVSIAVRYFLRSSLTPYYDVQMLLQKISGCKTLTHCTFTVMGKVSDWISADESNEGGCWDLQEASFPCLESIIIHGYINVPYIVQMSKFLLKNTPKLLKMVISIKGSLEVDSCNTEKQKDQFTWKKLQELVEEFSTFPRPSSQATIYVL